MGGEGCFHGLQALGFLCGQIAGLVGICLEVIKFIRAFRGFTNKFPIPVPQGFFGPTLEPGEKYRFGEGLLRAFQKEGLERTTVDFVFDGDLANVCQRRQDIHGEGDKVRGLCLLYFSGPAHTGGDFDSAFVESRFSFTQGSVEGAMPEATAIIGSEDNDGILSQTEIVERLLRPFRCRHPDVRRRPRSWRAADPVRAPAL
jgi:hypothetical protein